MKYTTGPLCKLINPASTVKQEGSKVQCGFHKKTREKTDNTLNGGSIHMHL